MNATVRGYLELAESSHDGPMHAWLADLQRYILDVRRLVGSDEHRCEICDVPNVNPDGTNRVFFWGIRDRWFCETHTEEFKAALAESQAAHA